jgi:flagellum-specific ATP synthase
VLESVSRVEPAITLPTQRALTRELRRLLAAARDAKDLIEIGAYVMGTNPLIDRAVSLSDFIEAFLCQDVGVTEEADRSWALLSALLDASVPDLSTVGAATATQPTQPTENPMPERAAS